MIEARNEERFQGKVLKLNKTDGSFQYNLEILDYAIDLNNH